MAVDEPWDDGPTRAVDPACRSSSRPAHPPAHRDDPLAVDGHAPRLEDPSLVVHGDDRPPMSSRSQLDSIVTTPSATGAHYMQRGRPCTLM